MIHPPEDLSSRSVLPAAATGAAPRLKAYSRQDDGHRSAYVDFVRDRLGAERIAVGETMGSAHPVLFLMVEEGFGRYLWTALARALRGRRTIGLLFRPLPCVASTALRHRVKAAGLRLLRRFRRVSTLLIVPVDLDPRFHRIADGSIHDFQLWDLSPAQVRAVHRMAAAGEGLAGEVRDRAAGRKVIVSLGLLNASKGFDLLARQYATSAAFRAVALAAAGGRVASESADAARAFSVAGGWLANRFVSDEELLALYATADAVWCYYEPDYDQASGILGRAMQLGLPVILRRGSLNHRFCERLGYPHVASDGTDIAADLDRLPPPLGAEEARWLVERFRRESLKRLSEAAGGPLSFLGEETT